MTIVNYVNILPDTLEFALALLAFGFSVSSESESDYFLARFLVFSFLTSIRSSPYLLLNSL